MLPTDLRKRGGESTIREGWSFLLADYRWLLPVLSAICKERRFLERMTSHPFAASPFSSSFLSFSFYLSHLSRLYLILVNPGDNVDIKFLRGKLLDF